MDDAALLRYSRQLLLPAIDMDGQERLLASTVLILGLGGLGAPAALYLAGAGVGTLLLADDDPIDLSNLPRQVLYSEADLGEKKSIAAKARLAAQNHTPDFGSPVLPHGGGAHGSRESGGPCARLHGPLRHSRRAQRGVPGRQGRAGLAQLPPTVSRAADGV